LNGETNGGLHQIFVKDKKLTIPIVTYRLS